MLPHPSRLQAVIAAAKFRHTVSIETYARCCNEYPEGYLGKGQVLNVVIVYYVDICIEILWRKLIEKLA